METLFDVASVAVNRVVVPDRRRVEDGSLCESAVGVVAEQIAIVELLRRGRKVAVPVVDDDGVDLVVDYRVRVQVKSSARRMLQTVPGYFYPAYAWSFKPGKSALADVFLLYGVGAAGEDRWWVVPARVVGPMRRSLILYEGSTRGLSSTLPAFEGAWDVFDG